MSYQKCPVCDGTGINPSSEIVNGKCTVCNGAKIISEITGQPPGAHLRDIKLPTIDIKQFNQEQNLPIPFVDVRRNYCNPRGCFCTGECRKYNKL